MVQCIKLKTQTENFEQKRLQFPTDQTLPTQPPPPQNVTQSHNHQSAIKHHTSEV